MRRYIFSAIALFSLLSYSSTFSADETTSPVQQSFLSPKAAEKEPPSSTPALPAQPPMQESDKMISHDAANMPSYGMTFAKMILTLAGLILLVITTVWLLKKLMQGKIGAFGKKHIQIIERRPLSPKTVLYVIESSGKQLIVAESQLEVKLLSSVDIMKEDS